MNLCTKEYCFRDYSVLDEVVSKAILDTTLFGDTGSSKRSLDSLLTRELDPAVTSHPVYPVLLFPVLFGLR